MAIRLNGKAKTKIIISVHFFGVRQIQMIIKKEKIMKKILRIIVTVLKILPSKYYIKIRDAYRELKDSNIFKDIFKDEKIFPRTINIEITNDCNLSCIMCGRTYWNAPPEEIKYMNVEFVKQIIDEASCHNSNVALFANGEPLLHPNLIEFIEYSKIKNIPIVSINTNATLLTKTISKKLVNSGLDSIVFSVDGINPKTYNFIRQKGNYAVVNKNILDFLDIRAKIKSKKPSVIMQIVPMIYNYGEIYEYIKFWESNLTADDTIFLHQICPFDPVYDKKTHFKIGIFDDKLKKLKKNIFEYRKTLAKTKNLPTIIIEDFKKYPRFFPCLSLWNDFYVPASGIPKVCWCSPDDMPRIFNIKEFQIADIFNHEIYKKVRKLHIMGKRAGDEFKKMACHKCRLWNRFFTKRINYDELSIIVIKERNISSFWLMYIFAYIIEKTSDKSTL